MSEREARLPPRPMISPMLWVLVCTYAGQRVVAWVSFHAEGDTVAVLAWGSLAAGTMLMAAVTVWWRSTRAVGFAVPVACLVVALLGMAGAARAGVQQIRCREYLQTHAASSVAFSIASDPSVTQTGYRFRAHVSHAGGHIGDVWLTAKERLERGSTVTCVGRYKTLGEDDYGRSSWRQGVSGSVMAVRVLSRTPATGLPALLLGVRHVVLQAMEPAQSGERALLAGCVCGSREDLKACGIDRDFSTCGMAHLIAVSGAHLALVSTLLAKALGQSGLKVGGRLMVLAGTTGLYVLFCGAPISAVRAWLMALAASGAQLCGRRAHALSSVCLVAILIVLADPQAGGQMGFELSVLSVIGLCLLSPYAAYVLQVMTPTPRFPRVVPGRVRRRALKLFDGLREALAATLVCQTVTLPVTSAAFGTLSLVAPLANVLVAPLVSPLLATGLLACLTVWCVPLCELFLHLSDAVSHLMLMATISISSLPYASVSVAGLGLLMPILMALPALPLVFWPKLTRRTVLRVTAGLTLVCFLVLLRWRCFAPVRMVVFDVGQGDAILVQDGASSLLVDTGPDDAIVDALARNHVLHLDAVLLTHLHDDHYGGLAYLKGAVTCDRVIVAEGVRVETVEGLQDWCEGLTHSEPAELSYGDVMRVGGYHLRMVWPHEAVDGTENCHSIELLATYEARGRTLTALLTGDAERDETGACLQEGDVGDIDVLKVGHHGSDVSITPEEAAALDPEVSVASAGEGNSYGHPDPACVKTLEDARSTFFCTKDVGDVIISPGRDGPVVRTQRTSPAHAADDSV